MSVLTRSQRRARAARRIADARRTPGRTAVAAVARHGGEAVTLDANPNRGKRDAAPTNYGARTLAPRAINGDPDYQRLQVLTPLRTPTGRHATRAGAPLYSQYTLTPDRRRKPRATVVTDS